MNKFKLLLAAGLFALAGSVSAAPIEGIIKFGGDIDSFDIVANTVTIVSDQALVVNSPSGTFAADVSLGDLAVYNSFTYSPLANVNPLWSVGGFDFELAQTTFIDESVSGFLDLQGLGFVTKTGYDSTQFAWSFSIDEALGTFTFSSTNVSVPEPGIALLLGIGLIGFGVTRKVRKSA